ncbi:MAG TPA: hypothetical protein VK013_15760, partial [Myxococcaceae bacterium]|nr:hypothetical protein [Myxococcaceae bacterium]
METKPPPDQYSHSSRKAWIALAVVVFGSFAILLSLGRDVYQEAPPVPDQVVDTHGEVVIPSGEIQLGQSVWQAIGGMELGSIWGHGAYVAPDWTADYLHREIEFVLDTYAQADHGTDFASLD